VTKIVKSTVIIPVFNHAALTRDCLDAVLGIGGCKVIVVDDASTDRTPAMLAGYGKKIQVLTHRTNQGFAKACNDGAKAARTEFVVFLNNDTLPQPGWLRALETHARKHPGANVIGSKLLYPDNTIQHAGVIVCQDKYPRHLYTGFPADHPAVTRSRRFQIVTAASMLVRRKIFTAARGFDTQFKNGFEDVDFCLRLGGRGHEIHYCAESVVQHLESVSPGRFKRDRENVALYRRRWLDRVRTDDLEQFIADGLLEVNYEGQFPLHLKVSPELAVLDTGRGDELEKKLATQSRQIADLTREVTKLRVELGHQNPGSQVLLQERERKQWREQIRRATPPGAQILVVSKGDSSLLELKGRIAGHFPQTKKGAYLGHHPAHSADATAHLESLSRGGAQYLAFPASALWWLDYYTDFAAALGNPVYKDGTGALFALDPQPETVPEV